MKNAVLVFILSGLVFAGAKSVRAENMIGAGAHYWVTIDDIAFEGFDDSGFSYFVSYQHVWSLLKLELDFEVFPEEFTGTDDLLYAPQCFLLLGSTIYAGAGVGVFATTDELVEEPFYILKAGLDLELISKLHLDINANYQFADIGAIKKVPDFIDTDSITLGAALRLEF